MYVYTPTFYRKINCANCKIVKFLFVVYVEFISVYIMYDDDQPICKGHGLQNIHLKQKKLLDLEVNEAISQSCIIYSPKVKK